jgi:hypothetical protein
MTVSVTHRRDPESSTRYQPLPWPLHGHNDGWDRMKNLIATPGSDPDRRPLSALKVYAPAVHPRVSIS